MNLYTVQYASWKEEMARFRKAVLEKWERRKITDYHHKVIMLSKVPQKYHYSFYLLLQTLDSNKVSTLGSFSVRHGIQNLHSISELLME